mgnify:CR=1 FL=1|jgi:hypothetical protein
MAKKTRNALPPVSLGVFRQMVYDCGAEMMSAGFNKDEIICRLMTLADYPIKPPTVKVIIEDGVPADVLTDAPAKVEIVDIDKDYEDREQLRAYRDQLYADKNLKSCDYTTADFKE